MNTAPIWSFWFGFNRLASAITQQPTLNPSPASAPSCSKEQDPTESVDHAHGVCTGLHERGTEFQNQLTPELTPSCDYYPASDNSGVERRQPRLSFLIFQKPTYSRNIVDCHHSGGNCFSMGNEF